MHSHLSQTQFDIADQLDGTPAVPFFSAPTACALTVMSALLHIHVFLISSSTYEATQYHQSVALYG